MNNQIVDIKSVHSPARRSRWLAVGEIWDGLAVVRFFKARFMVSALGLVLIVLPIAAFAVSLCIGRYGIPLDDLIRVFATKAGLMTYVYPDTLDTILFQIRLPRVIAAMLVGAALSIAGASYQGMFRNPMVSPDILGASAGAGFGAAVGILLSFPIWGVQISGFVFGLLAVGLTYLISTLVGRGSNTTLMMVLTGLVVSTMFQSLISLTKYVADPTSKLPAITFWLMGGLSTVTTSDVFLLIVPIVVGTIPLFLLRWQMNVLSFGDEEARTMGVNTQLLRTIIVICSTLATTAAVAVAGMVGWVGLVIPHIARMVAGPNYKSLLPVCLVIGGTYLLLVDDIARNLFNMEIPLGILTSSIGAPFFVYLLFKGRRGWN
jgi:iron complex transport system permease protein